MKALVKFVKGSGMNTLRLQDRPEPVPKNDEIKIKIMACGICGTDIHIMKDEYYNTPPVTIGHEYIGTVCERGRDVEGFEIGDHVVSLTAVRTCGKCDYCHKDLRMLCPERKSIGCIFDGAMAEYMTIPAALAFKVPPEVADKDSLVVSEPTACVVRAVVEKSLVKAGDVVLVSGPGTIGQLTAQVAKAQGAYVILAGLPSDEGRLALARKLGVDAVAASEEEILAILKTAGPNGADVVFECAGAESSARTCVNVVKKTGIFSQIGLYGKEIRLDMDKILYKEVSVTTSFATERTSWEIYLKLLKAGKLNLAPLVSRRLPLESWEEGFAAVLENKEFKIVLVP